MSKRAGVPCHQMPIQHRFAASHEQGYLLNAFLWLRSFTMRCRACVRGATAGILSLALSSLCWGIAVNDRVQVVNGSSNVRSTAAGSVLGTQAAGSLGTVVTGPTVASLSGTSYTWWNVNFDSGVDGWVADIGLATVALVPIISGISPTAMAANGSSQTLTVSGSNFAAGNYAQFYWGAGSGSNTWTTNNTTTVNSSSQINVSMNPGTVNDTIYVRVCNSAGACSTNTPAITVTAVALVPSISSISPIAMTANGAGQSLSINGSNFASGNYVQFRFGTGLWTNSLSTATINSSSLITISVNPGTINDTIYVRVCNNSGTCSSNTPSITVTAVGIVPTISNISPTAMTANGTSQLLTINGSNFASGNYVQFIWGVGSGSNIWTTNNSATVSSSSQITVSMNPGSVNDTIYVRVCNSSGTCSSNTPAITVTSAPATPLSFTSITPATLSTNIVPFDAQLQLQGANFTNVNQVSFSWSGPNSGTKIWASSDADWSTNVRAITPTSMTIYPRVLVATDPTGTWNWTVTLRDTSGAMRGQTFTVTYTTAPTTGTATCTNVPTSLATDMTYINNYAVGGKFMLLGIECTATPPTGSRYFKRFELLRAGSVVATAPANAYTVSYSNLLWSLTATGAVIGNWFDIITSTSTSYSLQAVMSDGAILTALPPKNTFWLRTGSNVTASILMPSSDVAFTTGSGFVLQNFNSQSSLGTVTGATDWYISSSTIDLPFPRNAAPQIALGGGTNLPVNKANPIGTRGWGLETVVLESSYKATNPYNVTYDKRTFVVDRAFDVGDPEQSGSGSTLVNDVDIATGNLHLSIADLSIPTTGVPLGYTRAYNSLSRRGGCTGVWRSNATLSMFYVDRAGGRQIGVRREDGRQQDFFRYTDGQWYGFNPGSFDKLMVDSDGTTFRLYTKGDVYYEFTNLPVDHDNLDICDDSNNVVSRSTGGNVTRILDRHGNNVMYAYSNSRVQSMTHNNGRTLSFTYAAGNVAQVASVTDGLRTTNYMYDADWYLSTVTDAAGKSTRFEYETATVNSVIQKRLIRIVDANGFAANSGAARTYTYDSSRRVSRVVDGEGNITDYAYATQPSLADSPISSNTTVTFKNNGGATLRTVTYSIDDTGNITAVNDTARTDSAAYGYSGAGSVTVGRPIAEVPQKALNTQRAPANVSGVFTTSYANPTTGNPTQVIDPVSADTRMAWTSVNSNLTNFFAPQSTTLGAGSATPSTLNFGYTANGALNQVIDARSYSTSMTRDGLGRLTGVTTPEFTSAPASISYLSTGEVASTTDAASVSETFDYLYTASGLTVTHRDKRSNQHVITHNQVGNVTSESHPLARTVSYTYDDNHNRTSAIERFSGVITARTAWFYDRNNRVTRQERQDASGTMVASTSYTYDALGRVLTTTVFRDALNNETTSTAYVGADLSAVIQPLSRTTSYAYDAAGRVAAITRASGSSDAITTNFTYDALGRRLLTNYADGTYEENTYVAGRNETWVASRRDRSGNTTQYQYDENGNLKTVTDPLSNQWTATYDKNNNLKTVRDPRNNTTTYTYDVLNRLTAIQDGNNRQWGYQYDQASNLTQSTTPSGGTGSITINRTYDPLNRPVTVSFSGPQGSGTLASYAYNDAASPRTAVITSGAGLASTATLDTLGRTTQFSEGTNRALGYGYDGKGNVTSLVYPGSRTVSYGYDAAGRLASVARGRAARRPTPTTRLTNSPARQTATPPTPSMDTTAPSA